ncbi:MAG: FtsX-like permease family protein [Bacteroidia bacterium]|nr:FtsX-like permease family protein [Bacteroidia bacterium]
MSDEGSSESKLEANGWPIGAILERDFPEVEKQVYMRNGSFLQVKKDDKRFTERIYFTGDTFFDIFTFPLASGNAATALKEPYSIVLTQAAADKYFDGRDALGKTLVLADSMQFVVTGVIKNVPRQSHMQFDMLISFSTYPLINKDFSFDGGWGNINVRNYILLKEGVDVQAFENKARNIYADHVEKEMKAWGAMMYVGIEPLLDIYLNTQRGNGMGPLGSEQRVYMVAGIALFVILLACINFVNLATARSMFRAREVGLRKVVGSTRSALIRQFLSESLVLTLMAFVVSIAMVTALLPLFNQLLGKAYELVDLLKPSILGGTALLIVFITFTAGFYPALAMSAMRPIEVLKGKFQSGARGVKLRRTLVVFQFVISIALVVGTMVVMNQLRYMEQRDLGFAKDQIIVVNASRVPSRDLKAFEVFKNELKALAPVEEVSFANAIPGRGGWVGQWAFPEAGQKMKA